MDDPTRLLQRASNGDGDARDELFEVLRPEMDRIARGLMRQEPREVTMQAGVLLSELYLRIHKAFDARALERPEAAPADWESREEFLAYATTAMRAILTDSARRRGSLKRGGQESVTSLESVVAARAIPVDADPELVLFIEDALATLAATEPEEARLLEMVRFGGVSYRAAGAALGMSRRKTEAAWLHVTAWLAREWGLEP